MLSSEAWIPLYVAQFIRSALSQLAVTLHSSSSPDTVCLSDGCLCVCYYVNCLFTGAVRQQIVVFFCFSATLFMSSRRKRGSMFWHWLVLFSVPRYTSPNPLAPLYILFRSPHSLTTQITQRQVDPDFILTLCLQEHTSLINGDNQITASNE